MPEVHVGPTPYSTGAGHCRGTLQYPTGTGTGAGTGTGTGTVPAPGPRYITGTVHQTDVIGASGENGPGAMTMPSRAELHASMRAAAEAAVRYQHANGAAKCDYHVVEGAWYDYERLWHTGQLIGALLAVGAALNDARWLPAATSAGNWMVEQSISAPSSLNGLLNSTDVNSNGHGCITDACDGVQVMSDVGDANGPLFELSKRTGNASYAKAGVASAVWQAAHMGVPGQPGLYYAALNKSATPPVPFMPAAGSEYGYTLSDIEGSLFLHACNAAQMPHLCTAFMAQADATVRAQDAHGLWLQWPPNDAATGRFHPRFNLWYASSLVDAHDHAAGSSSPRQTAYLAAAARTLATYAAAQEASGTIWYWNALNTSTGQITSDKSDVTGSGTAFLALVSMRILQRGGGNATLLRSVVGRSISFVVANQYSPTHPDLTLRGAYFELGFRKLAKYISHHKRAVIHRDIGTFFGLQALAAYDAFCTDPSTRGPDICHADYMVHRSP